MRGNGTCVTQMSLACRTIQSCVGLGHLVIPVAQSQKIAYRLAFNLLCSPLGMNIEFIA